MPRAFAVSNLFHQDASRDEKLIKLYEVLLQNIEIKRR